MKYNHQFILLLIYLLAVSCRERDTRDYDKGFSVRSNTEENASLHSDGFSKDSLHIATRPGNVMRTITPEVRLTTIYKLNYDERDETYYIGGNNAHYRYEDEVNTAGNNWNGHLMPGLEAVYGFNMVNVSHYSLSEQRSKNLFEQSVLIGTVYFPTPEKDTLHGVPVQRDYIMVSAYNEDTNGDGLINPDDLRRMFLFDMQGTFKKMLIPEQYAVYKSEYDEANDLMYIFARFDQDKDGSKGETEPTHIFWINLKDPTLSGRTY